MYKITITKAEENPNFKEEMDSWREKTRYGNFQNESLMQQSEVIKNVLMVALTDEQFKKVKAEVFKVFE